MEVGTTPSVLAGRYRVIDRLGAGGMATVYLADDERLGRQVAVKRLHSDSPADAARRFDREAKVGASLSHPNLVTVFDTVADDEGVLIVMEYVPGENLAELMSGEPMKPERAISIVKQVAAALDHAHDAGVIHRDVKPANILISPDGKAKLVDLGIATVSERTQITAAGTVLGTPSYMAPEQLEGGRLTRAVDVYALAAVAFELLSGRKARSGRTPVEIAHQVAAQPTPDLRQAWPDAPPAAIAALEQAMARDPRERPASAGRLAGSIENALRAARPEPTGRVPLGRTTRTRLGEQRARARRALPGWIPVAIVIALLFVVAGAIAALTNGGDDKGTAALVPSQQHKPAKSKSKPKAAPAPAPAQQQTTPGQPGANSPAAMQQQAHALIDQGKYDAAIALDKQVVAKGPGSGLTYAYALYDLGHALRVSGHPDQAIPVLQQRLQINNQRGVVEAELKKAKAEAGGG